MDALRNRLVTTVSAVLGVACLSPATGFATSACYAFTDSDPRLRRGALTEGRRLSCATLRQA